MLSFSSVQSLLGHFSTLREWAAQGPSDVNCYRIPRAIDAARSEARAAGLNDILKPLEALPLKTGSDKELESIFRNMTNLFQELEDRFDVGLMVYREPLLSRDKLRDVPRVTRDLADRLKVPVLLMIARAFHVLPPKLSLHMLNSWGLPVSDQVRFLASINFEENSPLFLQWINETHDFWSSRPLITPTDLKNRQDAAVAFWKNKDSRIYALNRIYDQEGGRTHLAHLMAKEMQLCREALVHMSVLEKSQVLRLNEYQTKWEPVLAFLHLDFALSVVDAICPDELQEEDDIAHNLCLFLQSLHEIDQEGSPITASIVSAIENKIAQILRIYSPQNPAETLEEASLSHPSIDPSIEPSFGQNEDVLLKHGSPHQKRKVVEMLIRQLHGLHHLALRATRDHSETYGPLSLFAAIQEEAHAPEQDRPDPSRFHADVVSSGILRAAELLLQYGCPPYFHDATLKEGTLEKLKEMFADKRRLRGDLFHVGVAQLLIQYGDAQEVPVLCEALGLWARSIARKRPATALDVIILLSDRPEREQYESDIESCLKILLNDYKIEPLILLEGVRQALKLRPSNLQSDIDAALKRLVFVGDCQEERLSIAMEAAHLWDEYNPDWDRTITEALKASSAEWLTAVI